MMAITKRQEEVLLNIHLGDQSYDGKRSRELHSWDEKDKGLVLPPWGRPARFGYVRSMGGATRRMMDAMGEAGLLPVRVSPRGYTTVSRSSLTAKGARHLMDRFPDLPGIADAVKAAEEREAAEKAKEQEEREAARLEREKRAIRRQGERQERMAAVLRDYQIPHSLTPDQLEAMWLRIVDEEMKL